VVSVAFFLMGMVFFYATMFVSMASSMTVVGFMGVFVMVTVTACVSMLVSVAVAVVMTVTVAVVGCEELVSRIIVGHVRKCSILNVTS